ncbi:hypothetical protein [Oenococcus sicerae]|uniref:hypothetical protein n=1 Tax=Oenococcus sicerae TaxID=2203724 RepID=UPI0010B22F64|nr:hypothetical protein OAL24_01417 [Oenococcus sicerae]
MKSSLWKNIRFPVGLWFEDTILPFLINPSVKKYSSVSQIVYSYQINPSGITLSSEGKPKSVDTLWVVEDILKNENFRLTASTQSGILFQLTRRMSRVLLLDKEIRRATFDYSCYLVDRYLTIDLCNNYFDRLVFKIFVKKAYGSWNYMVRFRLSQ